MKTMKDGHRTDEFVAGRGSPPLWLEIIACGRGLSRFTPNLSHSQNRRTLWQNPTEAMVGHLPEMRAVLFRDSVKLRCKKTSIASLTMKLKGSNK
jgi:hypothetical protein